MSEHPTPGKLEEIGKPFPQNDNEAADPPPLETTVPAKTIEPAWDHGNYYRGAVSRAPNPDHRGSDFSPMTWVMIVVAGIALGFVIAMTFAGA